MFHNVIFVAFFAFVDVSVSHLLMFIKFQKWLCYFAFKTFFMHGNFLCNIAIIPILILKGKFPNPQGAAPRLICKLYWRGVVIFGAYALLSVMVARMADPWRLGLQGGAVQGDYLGFGVSHKNVS
jgi:hypothetical protein